MSSPAERPKAKSLNPLLALAPFLRPYWGMMAAASFALLIAAGAQLALPLALRQLIDLIAERDAGRINRWFFVLLAAAVIFGVFAALRFYLVTWVGERVVADVRAAVYRRVVRMDPLFYETTRVGEVLSRLTADTTLVQAIAGVNLSIVLRSTLSLIGAIVLMGLTSAKLMGFILILVPVVIAPLDHHRQARARFVARLAGSHCRYQQSGGRDIECHPNRAGIHHGGAAERALSKRRSRTVLTTAVRRTKVRAALDRHWRDAGVWRHHLCSVAGRAPSHRRHHDRRPTRAVSAYTPLSSAPRPRRFRRCGARCNAPPAPWSA